RDIQERRLGGRPLALTGILTGVIGVFVVFPGVLLQLLGPSLHDSAARRISENHLKELGLALHSYHDAYDGFPRAGAEQSRDGKARLSWRVAILPYLDEMALYRQFNLEEPWDSPHNKGLLPLMPKVYEVPGDRKTAPKGRTFYRAFVGPGAVFDPTLSRS